MKNILIFICVILLLSGCSSNNLIDKDMNKTYEDMENILIEYGKLVYENETWLNGNIKPMTYYMSLREMQERNGYDISMFVNPDTNKRCNIDETRIEFIVKDTTTETKTDYEFNPVISCDDSIEVK